MTKLPPLEDNTSREKDCSIYSVGVFGSPIKIVFGKARPLRKCLIGLGKPKPVGALLWISLLVRGRTVPEVVPTGLLFKPLPFHVI